MSDDFAATIGAIVLAQVPTMVELAGIVLVVAGVALHRDHRDQVPVDEQKEMAWTT